MDNNGLVERKEGFMFKIKSFFMKLFTKNKEQNNSVQEKDTNETDEIVQEEDLELNEFFDDIKVDSSVVDIVSKRNNFLKEIDGNREMLEKLSIDRLLRLEAYYDKIIKENDEKIRKLKESNKD